MPIGKFRLLAGEHIDYSPTMKDRDGKPVEVKWRPGDVVANKRDLAGRWPERFARVRDDEPASPGTPTRRNTEDDDLIHEFTVSAEANSPAAKVVPSTNDGLDNLPIERLREIAEREDMIYNDVTKNKPALIAKLRKHRADRTESMSGAK